MQIGSVLQSTHVICPSTEQKQVYSTCHCVQLTLHNGESSEGERQVKGGGFLEDVVLGLGPERRIDLNRWRSAERT